MNPVVVGIAGGSASGKTRISEALAARLGDRCLLVAHDRYYHPASRFPAESRPNFDHPDSLDTGHLVRDLERLGAGQPVRMPIYDFTCHDRLPESHWEVVTPRPIVLVEGILVLAVPELRERLHHRVYVDTPDDIRLVRRVRRDLGERGRDLHDVLDQYEHTVRPMFGAWVRPSREHADLVVDGTCETRVVVDLLIEHLACTG